VWKGGREGDEGEKKDWLEPTVDSNAKKLGIREGKEGGLGGPQHQDRAWK
jgi:hypothetical protein